MIYLVKICLEMTHNFTFLLPPYCLVSAYDTVIAAQNNGSVAIAQ